MKRFGQSAMLAIATLVAGVATTHAATTTTMVGDCVPPVITQGLESVIPCVGDHVVLSVVATGTNLTYDWFHGQLPTSFHTATVDFPHITLQDRGLWCVFVSNECGNAFSCARISVNSCGGSFCTFTQGYYGNAGGQGTHTQTIINALSSGPLVIGEAGRSVTFNPGQATADCIVSRMPAGSGSTALPAFGDQTFNVVGCNTSSPLPLKNGKFKNVLFGQTLALALNLRNDPGLGAVNLCPSMSTSGGDITLNPAVLDLMFQLGYGHNTFSLLKLANHALAGGTDLGTVTLSDINDAVDAINEGFDECRDFLGCN